MKVNELMVGDWVKIKTYGVSDKFERTKAYIYVKIAEIGSGLITVEYNNDIKEPYRICENTEIEPIPLTPEILEKNGFEKTQIHGEKQDDIFQCFDGEIIIEVGTYDPNFILIHYRYETPDEINSGDLSSIVKVDGGKFYLHELQHALRLCGIEKEIEL